MHVMWHAELSDVCVECSRMMKMPTWNYQLSLTTMGHSTASSPGFMYVHPYMKCYIISYLLQKYMKVVENVVGEMFFNSSKKS